MICVNNGVCTLGIGAFNSRLKFRELMTTAIFNITSNNKIPQSLNLRHLVFPCTESDCSQLSQGGSKLRRPCQSTAVGGVCTELRHSDRNLRTALFENFKIGIKKKYWVDFMCTHTSNTHLCSTNLKSEFCIR